MASWNNVCKAPGVTFVHNTCSTSNSNYDGDNDKHSLVCGFIFNTFNRTANSIKNSDFFFSTLNRLNVFFSFLLFDLKF